jgi:hypothetical protein
MVKEPAIGQRSILADSIVDWLEVILKSGKFEPAACPARPTMAGLGRGLQGNRGFKGSFLFY